MNRYNQLHKFILNTLAYSDIFEYPVTFDQLYIFLISSKRVSRSMLLSALLEMKGFVIKRGNYYALFGREALFVKRKMREEISIDKIYKTQKVITLLARIPTVQMIGLTGSLSLLNGAEGDDIDICVITRKNSLWVTRIVVTAVLAILKHKRRVGVRTAKDKLCVNMYMSENALQIPKDNQNLYTAREVVQMVPIVNKNNTYEYFLEKNLWIHKYIPNKPIPFIKRKENNSLVTVVLWPVNIVCFGMQYIYMKRNIVKSGGVSLNKAFFYPSNRGDEIIYLHKKRYHGLLKKGEIGELGNMTYDSFQNIKTVN